MSVTGQHSSQAEGWKLIFYFSIFVWCRDSEQSPRCQTDMLVVNILISKSSRDGGQIAQSSSRYFWLDWGGGGTPSYWSNPQNTWLVLVSPLSHILSEYFRFYNCKPGAASGRSEALGSLSWLWRICWIERPPGDEDNMSIYTATLDNINNNSKQ